MVNVVIVSDSHLRVVEKYGKVNVQGVNSRLQDKINHLETTVEYAISHEVDYWIHLGDVFNKLNPPESLRNLFFKILEPLVEAGIEVIILMGNHDTDGEITNLMSDERILNMVDDSGKISIITEPISMEVGETGEEVKMLFIPWVPDQEAIRLIQEEENHFIFGHIGIDGAFANGTEILMSKGIPAAVFNHHRYAFLGHYHQPQKTGKYMYVGSIARVDFGERNEEKRFVHAKLTPTGRFQVKTIKFEDRLFIQWELKEAENHNIETLHNLIDLTDPKDSIVKLRLIGSESWYLQFNPAEIRKILLQEREAHKLFVEHLREKIRRSEHSEINISSSWLEGIQEYTRQRKEPEYYKLGKEILEDIL